MQNLLSTFIYFINNVPASKNKIPIQARRLTKATADHITKLHAQIAPTTLTLAFAIKINRCPLLRHISERKIMQTEEIDLPTILLNKNKFYIY